MLQLFTFLFYVSLYIVSVSFNISYDIFTDDFILDIFYSGSFGLRNTTTFYSIKCLFHTWERTASDGLSQSVAKYYPNYVDITFKNSHVSSIKNIFECWIGFSVIHHIDHIDH